ncbi:MAG: 50S ribosomal protein L20 [Thermodesulfobacteriota bacterium]
MRVKRGVASRRRRKRILKLAKGYWGRRGTNLRKAKETILRALAYSYRDRRRRKRDFRRLWIVRINAAARPFGTSYSSLIGALAKSGIELNRKSLAELAVRDPEGFKAVVESAKADIN